MRATISEQFDCRGVTINNKPAVNVLSQNDFQNRAETIFAMMDSILGNSFGPYGASTLISDYPYVHATKDGYTIASNITFDHIAGSPIDRVISSMALDICGRLNYAVGDGTTTAIIATNSMFKSIKNVLTEDGASSKDFLDLLNEAREMVIEEFKKEIRPITDDNMYNVMQNVTLVSTNGDGEISEIIAGVYNEFKYPILRCERSDTASTYLDMNEGYKSKVRLGDRIYVNSSDNTGTYSNLNVLVFNCHIKERTYRDIISPIYEDMRKVGSKLVVIAPSYDEVTLHNKMRRDIMTEYRVNKDCSLIIMSYPTNNKADKNSIYDLAMLLNTQVIDKTLETEIIDAAGATSLLQTVNICDRGIESFESKAQLIRGVHQFPPVEDTSKYLLTLGYADNMIADDKSSIFKVSQYDKNIYERTLEDAKIELDELIAKFQALGTYTVDVENAKARYISLQMNTAVIYVGGESDLSKGLKLDAVEDAVRAAESAYHNGYVLGGNVSLLRAILRVKDSLNSGVTTKKNSMLFEIVSAFETAFRAVYSRTFDNRIGKYEKNDVEQYANNCIMNDKVYDLVKEEYSDKIINSAKTDIEILTAVVDLLGILISGNQVVIPRYQHPKED
jgi:chaperonin GroEL (HSP60 family)